MPMPPQAAEISACLCLQQAVSASSAEVGAKTQAYDDVRRELAGLDAELARQKNRVDVRDPASVAGYKQLLERRDAALSRSTGPVESELRAATERYNARVGQHNSQCANRAFDSVLMAQIQATLSCPSPY